MKQNKIFMELNNCIGYGYWVFVSDSAVRKVLDFFNDFCMWGGHTKTYNNYYGYEMTEDSINFMKTQTFASFCAKNNIQIINSNNKDYVSMLHEEVYSNKDYVML